jgi:hypothetical protein
MDTVGNFIASPLTSTEIVPTEFVVGDSDTVIFGGGSIDTVKLNAPITATRNYTFPDAATYSSGEKVYFYNSVPPARRG